MSDSIRRHVRLMEATQFRMLLLEDRMDYLRKMFLPKFEEIGAGMMDDPDHLVGAVDSHVPGDSFGEKLLNAVVAADPSPAKKNSKWLCVLFCKGAMPLEDLQKATDYLQRYEAMKKAKQIPAQFANIEQFKSLGDLFVVINQANQTQVAASENDYQRAISQSKIALNTDKYLIVLPRTQEAANFFGRDTEWCTAWGCPKGRQPTRTSRFQYYVDQGPLYVILDKATKEKWQFHFETNQLMDVNDRQIDAQTFVKNHPEVAAFFNQDDAAKQVLGEVRGFRILYSAPTADDDGRIEFKTQTQALRRSTARWPSITLNKAHQISAVWGLELISAVTTLERNNLQRGWPYAQDAKMADLLKGVFVKARVAGFSPDMELAFGAYGQRFASYGLFWHKQWGSLDEVGDDLFNTANGAWVGLRDRAGELYLCEVTGGAVHIDAAITARGELRVPAKDLTLSKDADRLSEALVDLILHVNQSDAGIKNFAYEPYALHSGQLAPKAARRLVEHAPDLASTPAFYAAYGPHDERAQQKLAADFEENGVDLGGFLDDGDFIILNEYPNIQELVEANGNEVAATLIGEDPFGDWHFGDHEVDDDMKEEMMQALDPATLAQLGEYLENTYPSEVEEIDNWDKANVDVVMELLGEVDDDKIETCFRWAAQDGYRFGAEGQAYEAVRSAVDKAPIWYKDNSGAYKPGEMTYDTPCAIVVSIGDFLRQIYEGQSGLDALRYDGYLDVIGEKINVSEPHYGWNGYDASAAGEYFDNLLHDHVLNND